MSKIDRRDFLQVTIAGASVVSVVGCTRQQGFNRLQIVCLGEAVLPDEIGAEGAARISDEFITWIANYSSSAELNHAYGSSDLSFTGNLPTTQWMEQLQQLDVMARDRFSRSLIESNNDERHELLRDVLAEFPEAQLGDPARAEHVAIGLLAFFYRTPEATDLAYRASIKKRQCRPLGDSASQPISLS